MSDFLNPYEPIERHGEKLPHWQQEEAVGCGTELSGYAGNPMNRR